MKNRVTYILLMAVLIFTFTACTAQSAQTTEPKTSESVSGNGEKTVVTALYYETLPEFEALVESTYDDIDLEIEQSTYSGYNSDILRRLNNEHGKDLIFTSMPNSDIAGYAMDLSSNAFTTEFATSVMSLIEQDGSTEWLPMPGVYKGIIINKTLAEDLGKEVPTIQEELFELLAAAKEAGIGTDEDGYTFAVNITDGVSVGEMIISTMVPDFLGTMDGERWTTEFIEKNAEAEGTLNNYLSFITTLSAEGYMDPTRNNASITSRNAVSLAERLAAREMTAGYGYNNIIEEIAAMNSDDEFVFIPFLSAEDNPAWVTTTPTSYLGINSAISEDEEKLDAALRVLDLYSTPEGQAAILADTKSDNSYLTSDVEGSGQTDTELEEYVESGYVYNLDRFNSDILYLIGSDITKALAGQMELDEALAAVDDFNKNGVSDYAADYTLIGSVGTDLLYENFNTRLEETALGDLITDSIAELAGVDIAFANGGSIRASLFEGDVYTSDLAEVCPYGTTTIVVLDVTGDTIYQMLENSIQGIYYQDIPAGRFLQTSGINYMISVDPATENVSDEANKIPAKAELIEVTLSDGTPIERDKTYRIAVNNYMSGSSGYAEGGDGYTMLNVFDDATPMAQGATLVEDTGKTYADAIVSYFNNHKDENISPVTEGRITVKKVNS